MFSSIVKINPTLNFFSFSVLQTLRILFLLPENFEALKIKVVFHFKITDFDSAFTNKTKVDLRKGKIRNKYLICINNDQTKLFNVSKMTTSIGRRPKMLKVKYLSNYCLDVPQILNLSLCDQTKIYNCFK